MSTRDLERKVEALDENDLVRFSIWFDTYRGQRLPEPPPEAVNDAPQLARHQRTELDRRLDELDADLSIAVPWEGTIELVKARLEKLRAQKVASR